MSHLEELIITDANVDAWPILKSLVTAGRLVPDARARIRYPHGAPVGKMILVRPGNDGEPIDKESTEEWFDPVGPIAEQFQCPK